MRKIKIQPGGEAPYSVTIGRNLDPRKAIGERKAVIFHDGKVTPPKISGAVTLRLPPGEASKSFRVYRKTIDFLIEHDDGSPMVLVSCGGGAVGDVSGFAASTYRRGIPFIQMPTTLLAMVDASVGGKTAINHPMAKNMIGTFHQPEAVLADLDRLETLPKKEFRSGLAEVVKHGAILDKKYFRKLEKLGEKLLDPRSDEIEEIIARSVEIKGDVVARDTHEKKGIREFLNFGHTAGHAIEAAHEYKGILHGEAVSIGMIAAAIVSEKTSGFTETDRLQALLESLGFPTRLNGENVRDLIIATRRDKKRRGKNLRMTLLERIGKATVQDGIKEADLSRILQSLGAK